MPSIRLIILLEALSRNLSLTRIRNITLVSITMGRSKNLVVRDKTIGDIQALTPRIRRTLAIFEPNTFQMAISVFQEILASTETINSGILVPTATIVRPIIAWDIQNFFAIDTEPSTRTLPPKVRRISQKITAIHDNRISIIKTHDYILKSFLRISLPLFTEVSSLSQPIQGVPFTSRITPPTSSSGFVKSVVRISTQQIERFNLFATSIQSFLISL